MDTESVVQGTDVTYAICFPLCPSSCLAEELGSGEFSSVLKGTLKTPFGKETHVAVKKLKPNAIGHNQQEFMREASVLSDLDHRCIVKFIGICKDGPSIMLVRTV